MKSFKQFVRTNWRGFLARLPLPLLGLAASYGVYRYALVFVPFWVAVVTASSFEFVYIGLAVYDKFSPKERQDAFYVSVGAVVTSIAYNVLDGFFHRRPHLLVGMQWWGDLLLSIVHGAPLAILAFLVSRLVMHPSSKVSKNDELSNNRSQSAKSIVGGRKTEYTVDDLREFLDSVEYFKRNELADALGCSPATASNLINAGLDNKLIAKNNGGYVVI